MLGSSYFVILKPVLLLHFNMHYWFVPFLQSISQTTLHTHAIKRAIISFKICFLSHTSMHTNVAIIMLLAAFLLLNCCGISQKS